MSNVRFSPELFEQIGGVNWQAREGVVFASQLLEGVDVSAASSIESHVELSLELDASTQVAPGTDQIVDTVVAQAAESLSESEEVQQNALETPEKTLESELSEQHSAEKHFVPSGKVLERRAGLVEESSADYGQVKEVQSEAISIVVLGSGLDSVWQNESNQAWLLWQNIMQAFDWDESSVLFFDTANLVSEEMVFETMEEIIELGVEWVLTMDEEHAISEQLVEGVQVVSVPDLELMLSDAYSKQSFYHSVMHVLAAH